mmetsp:Transcript_113687/g.321469  ORF Transcript_113687/g.321469 Transcript_113687/m.321469 type:complete len:96 (-) Transcript_113687:255-542(-)
MWRKVRIIKKAFTVPVPMLRLGSVLAQNNTAPEFHGFLPKHQSNEVRPRCAAKSQARRTQALPMESTHVISAPLSPAYLIETKILVHIDIKATQL